MGIEDEVTSNDNGDKMTDQEIFDEKNAVQRKLLDRWIQQPEQKAKDLSADVENSRQRYARARQIPGRPRSPMPTDELIRKRILEQEWTERYMDVFRELTGHDHKWLRKNIEEIEKELYRR